jgi:hypothetical protein
MVTDVDLQVWLATQNIGGQAAAVLYLRSAKDMHLNYHMDVIWRGMGGSTRARQVGNVDAFANNAVALAHVTLDVRCDDDCLLINAIEANSVVTSELV